MGNFGMFCDFRVHKRGVVMILFLPPKLDPVKAQKADDQQLSRAKDDRSTQHAVARKAHRADADADFARLARLA